MNNFKKEWNESYNQGDNNILYPQAEVVKFLNRFICKRNNDGSLTRHLNKEKKQKLCGLDFGCGIGTHTATFNDFEIDSIGIDISEVAISKAIKNASKKELKNNKFLVQSSTTHVLPFKDNCFDFVLAESSLDSMPFDLAKIYIAELKRVTNGIIYASFKGHKPMAPSNEFVVNTQHEKGTIQSIFNQGKICKLFNTTKEKFIYFSSIDYTDCISKKLTSKRFYVVIKDSDVEV
jgi:ubiquinone/menaquinone biosynthesis C-methylase UbiE